MKQLDKAIKTIDVKTYYRDPSSGATASIDVHKDGTATLIVAAGGKRYKSEHKNENAAKAAWRRWCD